MKKLTIQLIILIIFFGTNFSSNAMHQKIDLLYKNKIKKTKTTTPSYCPCSSNHYMIYNSSEIIHLLYALHLPVTKESKESVILGRLIDKHVTKQEMINTHYKQKVEALIKALCAQVHSK